MTRSGSRLGYAIRFIETGMTIVHASRLRLSCSPAAGADAHAWSGDRGSDPGLAQKRLKIFRQARRHSWVVRGLRVLLPLAALASAAFYFIGVQVKLTTPQGEFTAKIPTFDGENFKMENPSYTGVTNEGGKFSIKAKAGYQDIRNANVIKLHDIDGHLTQISSDWAHLIANNGIYDSKSELLNLAGDVKVTSSNGMVAYLKSADVRTKEQIITTKDPVRVELATGTTIESDTMVINAKDKEITFEGNVRSHLVRAPDTKPMNAPVVAAGGLRGGADANGPDDDADVMTGRQR